MIAASIMGQNFEHAAKDSGNLAHHMLMAALRAPMSQMLIVTDLGLNVRQH